MGEVEGKGDAAPENPLQKELDIKNREIIDLKVRHMSSTTNLSQLPGIHPILELKSRTNIALRHAGQIPPLRS